MMVGSTRCPDCGGKVISIGPIPPTDFFAGRMQEHHLPGGTLYRCRECSLGFRWPRLSKEQLDTLYTQGSEVNWPATVDSRRDWRIARDWIQKRVPNDSRILDVGCFDGGFLERLVSSHRCFGIEIHPAARHRAEQNGIDVIGSDFSAIAGTFDCITAFDVIEHVERPTSFLSDCLAAVKTDGWVVISTGNLDAFTFRLMASRYWYCTIAEHISFVSPTWFSGLAGTLDFRIIQQTTFAHSNTSQLGRIREAANNLLYRFGGPAFRTLRNLGMGGKDVSTNPELADHPPVWGSARDHFMVVLQKR